MQYTYIFTLLLYDLLTNYCKFTSLNAVSMLTNLVNIEDDANQNYLLNQGYLLNQDFAQHIQSSHSVFVRKQLYLYTKTY